MSGKALRIALLAPASSVHAQRWANAFAQRGHQVHLLSQHAPLNGYDPHVQIHPLPHWKGAGYLLNRHRVHALLHRLEPEVVNAHYASGYGTLARGARPFPLVLNVWGSDVFEFPDITPLHRAWLLGNLRRADRLVSTSAFMAARVQHLLPQCPPITVVPFGVDVDVFRPGALGLETPKVIGTVKSLAHKYGIDILIRAFALIAGQFPDVRLRIIGGGPDLAVLQTMADRTGYAERIELPGAVPHGKVPEAMEGFSVFAALSRADSESFGVAVIEASACGLPVVVSDAGGLPEVVRDGMTGFIVRREDAEAAAAKFRQLLQDPALRASMGSAGRARVEAEYEWNSCVERQLAVFREAMAQSRKG